MTESPKFSPVGLTYDDVLLLPAHSDLMPSEADTGSRITRKYRLRIPIVSSPMDTVTEARMAIAMARQGGVGVLHRNLSIEDQTQQVDLVKRSEAGMITDPVTCGPDATLADVERLCGHYRISGVPVTSDDGILLGIVTNRDIRFESDLSRRVAEVMTPMPLVTAQVGVEADGALQLLKQHKIEKLPLVDEAGRLRGLITVKDFTKSEKFPSATKDEGGRLVVGAAVGVGEDAKLRAQSLIEAGVDFLIVDTAHGHAQLRPGHDPPRSRPTPTSRSIGGNVATRQGAQALIDAGADGVKVGVGPGSICTTRVVAGVGVPQITAIYEAAWPHGAAQIPVIGDGGLQYSGDIAKAITAGADTVMLGSLLAGCEKSRRDGLRQRQAVQDVPRHGLPRRHAQPGARQVLLQGPVLPGRRAPRGQADPGGHRGPGAVPRPALGGGRTARGWPADGNGLLRRADHRGPQGGPVRPDHVAGLEESHPHDVQMTVEAPNYSGRK